MRAVQVMWRRRRRRSAPRGASGAECGASACGLSPKEAAAAATVATCARHRLHATVSSESLGSPWGRRAIGRVGARRFDAAGVSNAAPTGTVHGGSGCLAARTDAGPAAACAAGLRPPPIRPAAWEASVGGVRGFRSLRARAPRVAGLGFARTALLHLYPSRERLYIQNTYNILRGHTYTI